MFLRRPDAVAHVYNGRYSESRGLKLKAALGK
jgi:hypothetical protein